MVFTISNRIIITKDVEDSESTWKPFLLALIASLPFFTHGIVTNTLTASAHSGHFVITPDDVPWSTTAMVLAAVVSGPIFCYIADSFGRKIGIYAIDLIQGASCIPLFFALSPDDVSTISLHVLTGISSAGIFTVLPVYLREVTSNKYRAVTLSLMMVMMTLGYSMKLAAGYDTMLYLLVSLAAVQLMSMYFLVETPSYYVKVGKIEAALTQMAKLKCLSTNSLTVTEAVGLLKDESERAKANRPLSLLAILKNQIWRREAKIGITLSTIITLCGSVIFLNQSKVLMQLKQPNDTEHTLVLYSLFGGSILCMLLIRFIERKILFGQGASLEEMKIFIFSILLSCGDSIHMTQQRQDFIKELAVRPGFAQYLLTSAFTIMVLSMGFLAVYTQYELTVDTKCAPITALVLLVISYGVAWGLPVITTAEMFNLEVRAKLLGMIYSYKQIIKLLHIHSFDYIENYVGIYTLLYIFAAVNLCGAVYSLFSIPDINGKNVRQIERQFKTVPLIEFKSVPEKKLAV